MQKKAIISYRFILLIFTILVQTNASADHAESPEPIHKLIIIGSGPAGLTAGIFGARAQLRPLILEGNHAGGHLISTTYVNNWPGEQSILGPDLIDNIRNHAKDSGCIFVPETAIQISLGKKLFTIITDEGNVLKARSLIIASGSIPLRLSCKGEEEYWGRGVSVCVTCDGPLYRDKDVIVVGGGDTAMEYASVLAKYVKSITIIQNLEALTASAPMQERILNNQIIKNIYYTSSLDAIHGDEEGVIGATIINLITGETEMINANGIFLAIGHKPATAFLKELIELDRFGFIKINEFIKTSVEGIFAAGDVICPLYKQAACAAGTGCMAALAAERYLLDTKQHRYIFEKK